MIGLLFLASVATMTYIVDRDDRRVFARQTPETPNDLPAAAGREAQATADLNALNRALRQWDNGPAPEMQPVRKSPAAESNV
jgi:hypothetical protein